MDPCLSSQVYSALTTKCTLSKPWATSGPIPSLVTRVFSSFKLVLLVAPLPLVSASAAVSCAFATNPAAAAAAAVLLPLPPLSLPSLLVLQPPVPLPLLPSSPLPVILAIVAGSLHSFRQYSLFLYITL